MERKYNKTFCALVCNNSQIKPEEETESIIFVSNFYPGKSDAPNFLRFGKSVGADDNEQFDRENRKPNFLRFG